MLLDDQNRVSSTVEIGVEQINEWTWVEARYCNSEPTVIEVGLIKFMRKNVLRKRKKVDTDALMVAQLWTIGMVPSMNQLGFCMFL